MSEHATILPAVKTIPASLKADALRVAEPNQDLYTDNLEYFPIQRKLSIGAVDDPLEDEADDMADKVMRMPEQNFIQRKCAHCEEEEKMQRKPREFFIQKKCGHCEEEEKAQRKPLASFIQKKQSSFNNTVIASDSVSSQIQSTKGSGNAMSESTKSFMESRFNADFSNVKIHTGNYASQLSKDLSAQAFTVGNDIYFNEGKYQPENNAGKHLLAHELTHTLQQNGDSRQRVQKKVSPDIGKIRSRLSYGIFDWAITNRDVREVLQYLRLLSLNDLRDTIATLEKGGFVVRIYENLAESSDRNLPWVQKLMQRIQSVRTVGPDLSEIRSHLSYGLFDWAITNEDVTAVLMYLRNLSDAQLSSAVASLERGGFIDRLYNNLSESDERKLQWVSELMQRIQAVRVHSSSKGGVFTGSCDERQVHQSTDRVGDTKSWAKKCKAALDRFINHFVGYEHIKAMLDRYFFHQAITGKLTEAQQVHYAERMKTMLDHVENPASPIPIFCSSPFDMSCSNALAYVPGAGGTVYLCQSYFREDANHQTATLFHELMHAYNRAPHVGDTGYSHERVFTFMPPDDSILNADSYTAFAIEVVLGAAAAQKEVRSRQDNFNNCNDRQQSELRMNIAYATRMLQNAINQITTPDFKNVQNEGNAATTHFHATQGDQLTRFIDRYELLQRDYAEYVLGFKCETTNAGSIGSLPFLRSDEGSIHLTPAYFALAAENQRSNVLLAILFRKHFSEMNDPVWASSQPAYANLTIDQAYQNPGSFVEYARQVTNQYDSWDYGNAEVRYREQAQRVFDGLLEEFTTHFAVSNFNNIYTASVVPLLRHWLADYLLHNPLRNHGQMQVLENLIRSKFATLQPLLYGLYDAYTRFWLETELRASIAMPTTSAFNVTHSIYNDLYKSFGADLLNVFNPLISQVIAGNVPAPLASLNPQINTLKINYHQRADKLIQLVSTYGQYTQQLQQFGLQYSSINDQIFHSLSAAEQSALLNDFFDDLMEYSTEESLILENIRGEVAHGRTFKQSRRRNVIPAADSLLKKHRDKLNQLVRRYRRSHRTP